MNFNVFVDDHYVGNFIEESRDKATIKAYQFCQEKKLNTEMMAIYGDGENPQDNGEWTPWSGRARWRKVFPHMAIGIEVNGHQLAVISDGGKAERIFCQRLHGIQTIGL